MSFLTPGFLWVAALALVGVVVAHLFSRSRPREIALPTARFVPEGAARAPTRARVPTDLLLLVVRATMVILVGTAFAQPVIHGARRDVARVFAVDVSTDLSVDAGARRAVLDSVRVSHRDGDAIIAFDTVARRVAGIDSLFTGEARRAPGSLSAGLIGGMRAASTLAHTADSVELVIVSPVRAGEVDSATLAIRARWPGRIRVIRAPARPGTLASEAVEVIAPADDPLRATVALSGGSAETAVRIVRNVESPADSAWVAAGDRVLVVWTASSGTEPPVVRAARLPGQADPDSIGAVIAGGRVVVAAFERAVASDAGPAQSGNRRVVARWMDGQPAATETVHGSGCIRMVGIPVPNAGDLAVRPEFVSFVRELIAPCGGRRDAAPAADDVIAALRGDGRLAASIDIAAPRDADSRLAAALLTAALVLALLEHLLRRAAGGIGRPAAQDRPRGSTVERPRGAGA